MGKMEHRMCRTQNPIICIYVNIPSWKRGRCRLAGKIEHVYIQKVAPERIIRSINGE